MGQSQQIETDFDTARGFVLKNNGREALDLLWYFNDHLEKYNKTNSTNLTLKVVEGKLTVSSASKAEVIKYLNDSSNLSFQNEAYALNLDSNTKGWLEFKSLIIDATVYDPENGFFIEKIPLIRTVQRDCHTTKNFGRACLDSSHRKVFLDELNSAELNPKTQSASELIEQLRPKDSSIPFNGEQILKGKQLDYILTQGSNLLNLNADLGLQYTLQSVLRNKIVTTISDDGLEQPSYVIFSHGHAIAGIAELAKWTRRLPDGKEEFLFDTSIYMPEGQWKSGTYPRYGVATLGAQAWGDSIEASKKDHAEARRTSAGGIAIGLNGHRGDSDIFGSSKYGETANIDPVKAFGSVESFVSNLQARKLDKIVVVVEHYVPDPSIAHVMPLKALKDSAYPEFDSANKDLYDYLEAVQSKGIKVIVVSGEQRVGGY